MPNSNSKISSFLQAINKYAEEQRDNIKKELEQFKRQELEKAEHEILSDVYIMIQKEMAEVRSKISKDLSHKEIEGRKELCKQRKERMDNVFSEVQEKLDKFTRTQDYLTFIEKCSQKMSHVLTFPDVMLYVRKEDLIFATQIKDAFKNECKINSSDEIKLGGIYGYSELGGIVVDETLDAKLEEQHKWFAENCGLKVT